RAVGGPVLGAPAPPRPRLRGRVGLGADRGRPDAAPAVAIVAGVVADAGPRYPGAVIPRNVLLAIGAGLLAAAIVEELRKAPEERTWEGRIGGLVPYDLRLATRDGFREAMQRPEEARVVLGAKVELPRAAKLARRALRF